ncbi:MAG TPA: hypothetical protein DD438_09805 [Verrucomicrobiales bacterium]|nr:hypothetical protein [Verrucomicrobiales bacterium]
MIISSIVPLRLWSAASRFPRQILAGFLLSLLSLPAVGQIRINEIVASNRDTLNDSDGDSSDWIEIFNTGTQLNLGGYSLTDDPEIPGKWVFPDGKFLGAARYLIVFASGKDRAVLRGQLHTNFSLDSGGDYLALHDPNGALVDEFSPSFPPQKRDIAYGVGRNGSRGYLSPSTPGSINGATLEGFVADTTFSHQRGFYTRPIEVTISSETPDATIRYTTDGREPTTRLGQVYTGPIAIASTTVLRAVAYKNGMIQTNVDAKSYLYTADIIQQREMDRSIVGSPIYSREIQPALTQLPVVSLSFNSADVFGGSGIHSNPSLSGTGSEREAHFEFFDPSDPEDSTHEPAGIRIHGGNARQHPKKNFRLYFRSDYGKTRLIHPLFPGSPVETFKSVLLRGGGHDAWTFRDDWDNASFIRNEFLHRVQKEMGQPSPSGRMVNLFMNGEYWGLYELQEFPHEHFNADHHGGDTDDWDIVKHGAEVESGNAIAWNEMINLAENGIQSGSEYAAIQRFVDIDNFADAMIHRIWSSDEDWLAPATRNGQSISTFFDDKNWYVARRSRNGEAPFIFYSWDAEMSMGIPFSRNESNGRDNPRSWRNNFTRIDNRNSPGIIYDALRQNQEFQLHFADRLHKHIYNAGALSVENLQRQWDQLVTKVQTPVVAESARWGRDSWGGSRGAAYTRNSQWIPAVNWVRSEFLVNRSDEILRQFNEVGLYPDVVAPLPSLQETQLSSPTDLALRTTTRGAEIYFTTDGADPRSPSAGGIVPLITRDHPVQAFVPSLESDAEIGTTWHQLEDPSNIDQWSTGPNGVGFEQFPASDPNFTDLVRTELSDMYNSNTSAYIRYKFNIPDQATIDSLGSVALRMRYDDGFVAYLNGVEIESRNAGATQWNSAATANHSDALAVTFVNFDQTEALNLLRPGENILAIHGLNRTRRSSDFLIQVVLEGDTSSAGGSLAPSAQIYTERIDLDQTTWIKARSRATNGSWSALLDVLYRIGAPASFENLRVTEIHYHPTDPETEPEQEISESDNDFEFIELQNIADERVDLSLLSFREGIDFQFPVGSFLGAGERGLVVSNTAAFLARYGSSVAAAIMGEFGDDTNLSNKGERLALEDSAGEKIFSFPYDDSPPWPTLPDGDGPSLVLTDPINTPEEDLDEGSRWRSAHIDLGAPNAADDWSYDLWTRLSLGPLDGADPLISGPDLITGPSGLSNFMLYAQGFDLGATSADQLNIVEIQNLDESSYLTLTYQLRSQLPLATITAEVSDDLQNWSPNVVVVSRQDNNDGTVTITVRDSQPTLSGQQRYIRVRIEE